MKTEQIVCIGGLGGSGTRVYSQILQTCGYFIGNDLNKELDNLLFTRLFKNVAWYSEASNDEIKQRLAWFRIIMEGKKDIPLRQIKLAILNNKTFSTSKFTTDFSTYNRLNNWAWKEPNSHIYIKHLALSYSSLKFILIIRHGLDMAFSSNTQQLENWGKLLYDIEFNRNNEESVSRAQLRFWIEANNRCIKDGKLYLGENFLVCNFDKLCREPRTELTRLINFLDHKVEDELFEKLVTLPKLPKSSGRYKQRTIRFSTEQLTQVHKLNLGLSL